MRRQRKTHKVEIGDFVFTSQESITQAKEQMQAHVHAAYTDIQKYTPYVREYRGNIAIMWRTVDGYTYRIMWDYRDQTNYGRLPAFSCTTSTEEQTLDTMLMHLAHQGWNWLDGTTGPDFLNPMQMAKFAHWAKYQLSMQDGQGNYLPIDKTPPAPLMF